MHAAPGASFLFLCANNFRFYLIRAYFHRSLSIVRYFTSALPRALSGTVLLIPLGLLRRPTRPFELLQRPLAALDSSVGGVLSLFRLGGGRGFSCPFFINLFFCRFIELYSAVHFLLYFSVSLLLCTVSFISQPFHFFHCVRFHLWCCVPFHFFRFCFIICFSPIFFFPFSCRCLFFPFHFVVECCYHLHVCFPLLACFCDQ